MSDLMGWAAVIVALTAALVAVFGQYNTRRTIKDAAAAAAMAAEEQKVATAEVHTLVNHRSDLQESKLDAQESTIAALTKEIIRLQHPDAETPSAHDPAEKPPVTLNGGVVTVEKRMKRRTDDPPESE